MRIGAPRLALCKCSFPVSFSARTWAGGVMLCGTRVRTPTGGTSTVFLFDLTRRPGRKSAPPREKSSGADHSSRRARETRIRSNFGLHNLSVKRSINTYMQCGCVRTDVIDRSLSIRTHAHCTFTRTHLIRTQAYAYLHETNIATCTWLYSCDNTLANLRLYGRPLTRVRCKRLTGFLFN